MTGAARPSLERTRLRAFPLWARLMLLVVLLSAAPTSAQPRTRLVGSAFDPASVSVVVRPKNSRVVSTAVSQDKSKLPDDHGGSVLALSMLAVPGVVMQLAPCAAAPVESAPAAVVRPRVLCKANPPRAPPAA